MQIFFDVCDSCIPKGKSQKDKWKILCFCPLLFLLLKSRNNLLPPNAPFFIDLEVIGFMTQTLLTGIGPDYLIALKWNRIFRTR
jgi:hypothetical protein